MNFVKCLKALSVFGSVLGAALPASAVTFNTFTDRTTFENAITGTGATIISEDFNSQPLQTFTGPFSLDLGDFIVSSGDIAGDTIGVREDQFVVNVNPIAGTPNIDGTRFFGVNGTGGGPSFTIGFDTPRFVFGFDYEDQDTTDSYAISLLGQTFENPPFGTPFTGTGFFGITSDTAFTEVDFFQTAAGGFIAGFGVDNLITSENNVQQPIPFEFEGTIGLFALGGLIWFKRRKKRNQALLQELDK